MPDCLPKHYLVKDFTHNTEVPELRLVVDDQRINELDNLWYWLQKVRDGQRISVYPLGDCIIDLS